MLKVGMNTITKMTGLHGHTFVFVPIDLFTVTAELLSVHAHKRLKIKRGITFFKMIMHAKFG
jgi:hypothetical protein